MSPKIAIVCFLSSIAFGQFNNIRSEVNGDTMTATLSSPHIYSSPAEVGMPYSGERISEQVQTLADGTHITQKQPGEKVWRDSQGRTRTERQIGAGPEPGATGGAFVLVEVRDPVAGFFYVLDAEAKVAHRYAMTARPARKSPAPATTATQVPAQAAAAANRASQYTNEKLGTDNIEGLVVEGTRSTRTIPVGEIGNDRPISTTNESWFSRDLRVMVLTKSGEPRYGDNTIRLTNISRSEPDPALFAVPEGYATVDGKDTFSITLKRQ